jgi:hypothetical protein
MPAMSQRHKVAIISSGRKRGAAIKYGADDDARCRDKMSIAAPIFPWNVSKKSQSHVA